MERSDDWLVEGGGCGPVDPAVNPTLDISAEVVVRGEGRHIAGEARLLRDLHRAPAGHRAVLESHRDRGPARDRRGRVGCGVKRCRVERRGTERLSIVPGMELREKIAMELQKFQPP